MARAANANQTSKPRVKSQVAIARQGAELSPHHDQLPRLKRVRGQVEGIEKMILDKRYCIEILQQIKAARSALLSLEALILETHLKGCVRNAIESRDGLFAEKKIQEISDLLTR